MTTISPKIDKIVQIISKDKVVVRAPGLAGPKGDIGTSVLTGIGAPANNIGRAGDLYIDTENKRLYGPKDHAGWDPNLYSVFAGSSFYAGIGSPDQNLGNNGDSYLDTTNTILYAKQNNRWGSAIELIPVSKFSFTYEKQTAAPTWSIIHNLGFNPAVSVMDYSENNIECDIEYVNENQLTLRFIQAGIAINVSGYAYLS